MFLLFTLKTFAQVKIGNNPTAINSASLLELESTNQGFVFPRIALVDVNSSSPLASGLLTGTVVYSTTNPAGGSGVGLYLWNGSAWSPLASSSSSSSSAKIEIPISDDIVPHNFNDYYASANAGYFRYFGNHFSTNSTDIAQGNASALANYVVTATGQLFNGAFGWIDPVDATETASITIYIYKYTPLSGGTFNTIIPGTLLGLASITLSSANQTYFSIPSSTTILNAGDVLIFYLKANLNTSQGVDYICNGQIEILNAP